MTLKGMSIPRRAFQLLTLRFLLMQCGLALVVLLLSAVWLRIPDSTGFEIAFTVLLGLLILALALGGETALLLQLRGVKLRSIRVLRGAVVLLIASVLWCACSACIDHLSAQDLLRAGYLNSRFSHSSRNFFSFPHLLLWFGWLWIALRWLGTGVLLALAVPAVQMRQLFRPGLRVLGSASYWLEWLTVALLVSFTTDALTSWTPGHGLRAEMISVVLRLGVIAVVDLVLGCYLLTTITAVVERWAIAHATPGGTLETSQPRTEESP
jgi:hypothetical protein